MKQRQSVAISLLRAALSVLVVLLTAWAMATPTDIDLSVAPYNLVANNTSEATNNANKIQNAIDSLGGNPGALLFPAGTFYINKPIFAENYIYPSAGDTYGMKLIGQTNADGTPSTILQAAPGYAGALLTTGLLAHINSGALEVTAGHRVQLSTVPGFGTDGSIPNLAGRYALRTYDGTTYTHGVFPASPLTGGPMYTSGDVNGRPSCWEHVDANNNVDQFTIDVAVYKNAVGTAEAGILNVGGGHNQGTNVWLLYDSGTNSTLYFQYQYQDGVRERVDLCPGLAQNSLTRITIQWDYATGYLYAWVNRVLVATQHLRSYGNNGTGGTIPLKPWDASSLVVGEFSDDGNTDYNVNGNEDFELCGLRLTKGLRYQTNATQQFINGADAMNDYNQFFDGASDVANMVACLPLTDPPTPTDEPNDTPNDKRILLVSVQHGLAADAARTTTYTSYGFWKGNDLYNVYDIDFSNLKLICNDGWGAGLLMPRVGFNRHVDNITATGGFYGIATLIGSTNNYPCCLTNCTLDGTEAAYFSDTTQNKLLHCTITPGRRGLMIGDAEGGVDGLTVLPPKPYMEQLFRIAGLQPCGHVFSICNVTTQGTPASLNRLRGILSLSLNWAGCNITLRDWNIGWSLPATNTFGQHTAVLDLLCGKQWGGTAQFASITEATVNLDRCTVGGTPGTVIRQGGAWVFYTRLDDVRTSTSTNEVEYAADAFNGNTNQYQYGNWCCRCYTVGEIVSYNGTNYLCTTATPWAQQTPTPPPNPTYWYALDNPTNVVSAHWDTVVPAPNDARVWLRDAVEWNVENPISPSKPWSYCSATGTGNGASWIGSGTATTSTPQITGVLMDGVNYTGTPFTIAQDATASFSANVIHADSADGTDVLSKIEFFLDNSTAPAFTAYPNGLPASSGCTTGVVWISDGNTHTLTNVKAYDTMGASYAFPPHAIPTVSITAPANNTVFAAPANVTITATATASAGSISQVSFYQGGTPLNTDFSSPYSYTWNSVAAGSYALTAVAQDSYSLTNTSSTVNIIVDAPPTVSITSPLNGATFTAPASVTINANASDSDGTVSKVEFYQGATPLGTDSTSPYAYTWTGVAQGSYSLTAKAYDNYNIPTTSTAVNITVNPALPSTGMLLWLAADSLALNNNDPVNSWTDISGNGRNAASIGGAAPVYTTNVFNGKPVVRFNGNSLLQVNSLPMGPYTIIAVFKTTGNSEMVYEHGDNIVMNDGCMFFTSTNSTVSVRRTTQTGKDIVCSGASTWAANHTAPMLAIQTFDGTDAGEKLAINSSTQPMNQTYTGNINTQNVVTAHFNVGARAGGYLSLHGDVAEIVVYDHVLNSTDLTQVQNVLNSKYALNVAPTVSLTAPANNANFIAPASIAMTATASDSDGSISKVEFYNGSTLLGTDSTSPYAYTWTSVPIGNYALTALAYDNLGFTTVSSTANVTVTTLPTTGLLLWLRADTLGLNNNDPVTTWTDASGNGRNAASIGGAAPVFTTNVFNGLPVVRFNGNSLLQVNSLPMGPYTILLVMKTTSSNEMVYEHGDSVIFNDGCMLFTGTNSTVSVRRTTQTGKDLIGANAGTWAAGLSAPALITHQFDGTDAGEKLSLNTQAQPLLQNYTGNINTSNVVSAHFNIGARAGGYLSLHGDIAEIVVYDHVLSGSDFTAVNNALMTKYALETPPTTSITSPANNSSYTAPASITINATATANAGSISKVEFYDGTTLLGTATTSPYSYAWSNAEMTGGSVALTTKAYDTAGFATASTAVNITVNDSYCKAYWKFDADTGTSAADSSGVGNTGTITGATWQPGKIGCSLSFNGTSNNVQKASASSLPAANATQTIGFWLYVSATPSAKATAVAVSGSSSGVYIGYSSSTTFGVWKYNGTLLASTTSLPSVNAWHYITYVKSGSTNYLYIDGVQKNTSTTTTDSSAATTLTAGMTPGGTNYFAGMLDEIRVYTRALSATEISGLAAGRQ